MTIGFHQQTAKIYQFPINGRNAAAYSDAARLAAEIRSSNVCAAASGGSWYHDEAVREAERPVKP